MREQVSIPTAERDSTLARINSVLDGWQTHHGSIEAIGLIAAQVRTCESIGVNFLCCPEGVLGGLADYASRPYEIAFDVQSGQLGDAHRLEGREGCPPSVTVTQGEDDLSSPLLVKPRPAEDAEGQAHTA